LITTVDPWTLEIVGNAAKRRDQHLGRYLDSVMVAIVNQRLSDLLKLITDQDIPVNRKPPEG